MGARPHFSGRSARTPLRSDTWNGRSSSGERARFASCPTARSVRVGVDGDGQERDDAYAAAASLATAVDAVLASAGEAISRVTTVALVVQPKTRWKKGESVRTGWKASRTSIVEIVALDELGALLAKLAAAGGSLFGPSWELDLDHEVRNEARRRAVLDARARAEAYADGLGLTLGPVAWVSEPGLRGSDPGASMAVRMAAAPMAMAMGGAPEETIDVSPEEIQFGPRLRSRSRSTPADVAHLSDEAVGHDRLSTTAVPAGVKTSTSRAPCWHSNECKGVRLFGMTVFADRLAEFPRSAVVEAAGQSAPMSGKERSMTKNVYQLKATIAGAKPPVWRRVVVAEETTLRRLHDILQAAFGWLDCHLHEFEIDGVRYGIDDGEGWGEPPKDERRARLRQVVSEGSVFRYVYDFGDNWQHKIVVEKVVPAEAAAKDPSCTGGRRACPPEDCGGVWGYKELLKALADPDHEDHESMLEWVGGEFDADAFDPADFSHRLRLGRLAAL